MAQDPVELVGDEVDRISRLPDDVLLDILGRLAMAGDVHTVARTSILSRRWRSLLWPRISTVSLDIGEFFRWDDDGWRVWRSRRRRLHPFAEQREATAGFTDALARFLAAPPSARVIETLRLKFILTRHDYVRRVGEIVGAAADAGAVNNKTVELELVTEMAMASMPSKWDSSDARTKLGYGERFRHLVQDCPGAFRSLTKLALQHLWFDDPAEVNNLVRSCHALQHLSLTTCGLCPKALQQAMDNDDEAIHRLPMLTIDAPRSRLQTLVCNYCFVGGVELVQAPELVTLNYGAGGLVLQDYNPVSFGCAPSLRHLSVGQYQRDEWFFKIKLSELLVNIKSESLHLAFQNGKIWVQPERPSKQLRAALGSLKSLLLRNIYAECNYLSWTTFLLESAPLLENLEIHICSHICLPREKRRKDKNLAWKPSPEFKHNHLKQLSFRRAFHAEKDLPLARRLMMLAPNLQGVTLGVRSLECPKCLAVQRKRGVAASRLRFTEGSEHVDAFVRALKDGIHTSAQITLILPELV